ncbi:MAG: hypothetical protein ACFFDW_14680, partial [Candidatus Thorarchaeota archaeon]
MPSTNKDEKQKLTQDFLSGNLEQNQTNNTNKSLLRKTWHWLVSSKQRLFSLIFLLLFIGLMIALGVAQQDPTHLMLDIVWWFQNNTGNLGLYIGVGIISIFGNFVMFIPVLYAAVLMFVAFMDVNIFLLGVAAGIGASIGQIASWFVGRATREIASEKMEKQLRKTQRWVDLGIVPLIIFIFAATPLPDEVILIMIGLVGYSLAKTLFFCFLGKMVLTLSLSYLAHYFSRTIIGNWLLNFLFGLTIENLETQVLPTDSNIWTSIAVWIIAATMVVLVAFIDWVEIFDKRKCKREQQQLIQVIRMNKNKNPQLSLSIENDSQEMSDDDLTLRVYT